MKKGIGILGVVGVIMCLTAMPASALSGIFTIEEIGDRISPGNWVAFPAESEGAYFGVDYPDRNDYSHVMLISDNPFYVYPDMGITPDYSYQYIAVHGEDVWGYKETCATGEVETIWRMGKQSFAEIWCSGITIEDDEELVGTLPTLEVTWWMEKRMEYMELTGQAPQPSESAVSWENPDEGSGESAVVWTNPDMGCGGSAVSWSNN